VHQNKAGRPFASALDSLELSRFFSVPWWALIPLASASLTPPPTGSGRRLGVEPQNSIMIGDSEVGYPDWAVPQAFPSLA